MLSLVKLLKKFNKEEKEFLIVIINKLLNSELKDLDVKKLKGFDNIFRVRKGKLRIIFSKENKEIYIMAIERRSDSTYHF